MWPPNSTIASSLLLALSILLSGCDLPYYWQAAQGHWDLMQRKQPIHDLLQDDATPASTRESLTYLLEARQFAVQQLGLEDNPSYLEYVELEREYVTWNVFATPELSMQNHTWCYPVAGCVSYRGYFARQDAEQYAAQLQQAGLDTYVGGVGAYSTLGWFADPVLSSFLERGPLSLAALLFHELAHQVLYVQDDTVFNESFASAVETILLQQWAEQQGLQNRWQEYQTAVSRHQAFIQLVLANRAAREALFEAEISAPEQRRGKQALITQLRAEYERFKQDWGYSGYDSWFAGDLNNAQLSTVATYHELKPGFIALFQKTDQNLGDFLDACRTLAEQDQDQRRQRLIQLAHGNFVYTQD
ncbi:aminopeptidase [Ketobacter sp.]|uniref:aminopeptidase n=1 Tax=Ketobacter sp. TaxID=2083498 RepID=UPI000F279349|nr:aminopeptidase [Ketobacter sp.]RLU01466.1 MAG: aminopeptidase [Ketobacter sp.]